MNMSRNASARLLAIAVATAIGCFALPGCATSTSNDSWAATQDDSLGVLAIDKNEEVVMGNAWLPAEDGSIQLQFAAGSIPEPKIERVELHDDELHVTMASNDGPATMDFHLHQFTLIPPKGTDASAVERVTVSANGNDAPAQRAETAVEL